MFLLITRFDRKVTPELGLWGYNVMVRTTNASGNGDTPRPMKLPRPTDRQPKDITNPGAPRQRGPAPGEEMAPRADEIFLELKRGCANININR